RTRISSKVRRTLPRRSATARASRLAPPKKLPRDCEIVRSCVVICRSYFPYFLLVGTKARLRAHFGENVTKRLFVRDRDRRCCPRNCYEPSDDHQDRHEDYS